MFWFLVFIGGTLFGLFIAVFVSYMIIIEKIRDIKK